MAARALLILALGALLCAGPAAAARTLQQTADASLIADALNSVAADPPTAAALVSTLVDTTGSTANFTDLLNQAVSAIGGYRSVVQDQLPAPVSSLNDLKGVNGLDTALAARAATYVIQQLGENKYQQVVDGLKALLNPSGASTPSYISAFDSYNTALAFVQALGHTQDSNGDTVAVADSFLAGLEGAAQSCITSLPSLNGAPEATAVTDQLNKCCPVIKKTLDDANTLAGKSGLVNFLVSEQSKYDIVSKCSKQPTS
ncbi:hypothetical protein COCSUDRAFT_54674 [Coccomyxa subellipsoidea C-169]|uniref:Uncharacterized protein n=1 Tax=Coccomyxa subellipsoidea (strain C-169) TaxID=574566 RepID=I0YLX2_COCSC|nr:hypothetical protein COCSUDRAFT_54674 [Coccomyxa subellipsoidea C-169]EIE19391.1 hypothetical protein COCSUDRAFT_54674 [Coccomyxa subellipsoidea C-169]|eukprot:XP_005643935.1 hypothetical protein COCSUDRAFT_54674 [Coccomyxa subellipsoidea C-169]